jgi:hypothetical protein
MDKIKNTEKDVSEPSVANSATQISPLREEPCNKMKSILISLWRRDIFAIENGTDHSPPLSPPPPH